MVVNRAQPPEAADLMQSFSTAITRAWVLCDEVYATPHWALSDAWNGKATLPEPTAERNLFATQLTVATHALSKYVNPTSRKPESDTIESSEFIHRHSSEPMICAPGSHFDLSGTHNHALAVTAAYRLTHMRKLSMASSSESMLIPGFGVKNRNFFVPRCLVRECRVRGCEAGSRRYRSMDEPS